MILDPRPHLVGERTDPQWVILRQKKPRTQIEQMILLHKSLYKDQSYSLATPRYTRHHVHTPSLLLLIVI